MNYSKSQEAAIRHKDGPMLVLAGPGSGKTAVITQRIVNLIKGYGVDASGILVITFTKAAANEMKQRFLGLSGLSRMQVSFGTFHAVFFTVLKHAYRFDSSNIITEEQRCQFMREILSYHQLDYRDENEFIADLLGEISLIKNTRIDLANFYSSHCGEEVFRKIYEAYGRRLSQNRLIDFDDMLTYTYELFVKRPDILSAWQRKYPYILIDEFQDINRIQYDIVRMMAAPRNNLFIVGDDDQSIYRFRGARPELMRRFLSDYADAKQLCLEENYRCASRIVQTSLALIGHNQNRFEKHITPARPQAGIVSIREYPAAFQENRAIIEKIRELAAAGVPYRDMAVLGRTNRQPGYLMEQLMAQGIPFFARETAPLVYDHWAAKDLLCYLRLGAGGRRRSDFLQIMNRPLRYLSRDVLDEPQVDLDRWEAVYGEQPWIARRIAQMAEDLEAMRHMGPFAAMNYVRKGIGYEEFVIDYARTHGQKEQELIEILDEVQQSASGFSTLEQWQAHIEAYRKRVREELKKRGEAGEGVQILTLHGAKGLEFDTVFLPQLLEGQLPGKRAVLEADIEEERRLFYVGMTRARERLFLSWSKTRYNKEAAPSRFLAELQNPAAAACEL